MFSKLVRLFVITALIVSVMAIAPNAMAGD